MRAGVKLQYELFVPFFISAVFPNRDEKQCSSCCRQNRFLREVFSCKEQFVCADNLYVLGFAGPMQKSTGITGSAPRCPLGIDAKAVTVSDLADPRACPVKRGLHFNCHLFYEPQSSHLAAGQNQWYHFGVGAPPTKVYFSGDWDFHWGYDLDFDPWPLVFLMIA